MATLNKLYYMHTTIRANAKSRKTNQKIANKTKARIDQASTRLISSCSQNNPTRGKRGGKRLFSQDLQRGSGVRGRSGRRQRFPRNRRNNSKSNRDAVRTTNVKTMVNDLHNGSKEGVSITNRWIQEGEMHLISGITEDAKHNRTLITGAEFLTSVDVYTPTAVNKRPTQKGEILLNLPLQPRLLLGTRFEKMSEMYQNYVIDEMAITLIPVVPSIQAGSTIGFINYDPDFSINQNTVGAPLLKQALNFEGAENSNVYNAYTMVWKEPKGKQSLFLEVEGSDPRLTTPGVFYLISGSNFPSMSSEESITLYNVWFSYKVEFFDRAIIEPPPIIPQLLFDNSYTSATFFFDITGNLSGIPVIINSAFFNVEYQDPSQIYQLYIIGSEQSVISNQQEGWAYGVPGDENQLMEFVVEGENRAVSRGTIYYVKYYDPQTPTLNAPQFYLFSSLRAALLDDLDVFHMDPISYGNVLVSGILTPLSF